MWCDGCPTDGGNRRCPDVGSASGGEMQCAFSSEVNLYGSYTVFALRIRAVNGKYGTHSYHSLNVFSSGLCNPGKRS